MSLEWRVRVRDAETSAIVESASSGASSGVFICAHGAGGSISDRGTLAMSKVFRATGLDVVRFNFLYKERGSSRPDLMPLLKETVFAVMERARLELGASKLFIGGRSMGGRAASMLAAEGCDADGLILLAYPLHPSGAPEKLRDAHLPAIKQPVLCINGTRDSLCTKEIMDTVVAKLGSNFTMHWVDGADHSFHVPKSTGRTDALVLDEMRTVASDWLSRVAV